MWPDRNHDNKPHPQQTTPTYPLGAGGGDRPHVQTAREFKGRDHLRPDFSLQDAQRSVLAVS